MRLLLKTRLSATDAEKVFTDFDKDLFEALKPPFLSVKTERFDGVRTGDEIHLKILNYSWISLITDRAEGKEASYFIDEGSKLPWPLTKWKHIHWVKKIEGKVCVVDEIEFESDPRIPKPLVWFGLYVSFLARKPIYKRYFKDHK